MLLNRLLTANWLPEIKIETGGWRNKQREEWSENTWNWNRFLCFSDDKWERKTLRQQRTGKKERGCIFLCTRLNVRDHVHLMKKASQEDRRKKTHKNKEKKPEWMKERKEARSALCKDFCFKLHVWPDVVRVAQCSRFLMLPTKTAHLRTPHISHALGKNQLNEEETRQNPPLLSAPLCSANPWWSFQVVHKLAHNNSCLHCNYILLTVRSFVCVSTVCIYSTGTRLEPNPQLFRPLVGGIEMFLSVLCEIIS